MAKVLIYYCDRGQYNMSDRKNVSEFTSSELSHS